MKFHFATCMEETYSVRSKNIDVDGVYFNSLTKSTIHKNNVAEYCETRQA